GTGSPKATKIERGGRSRGGVVRPAPASLSSGRIPRRKRKGGKAHDSGTLGTRLPAGPVDVRSRRDLAGDARVERCAAKGRRERTEVVGGRRSEVPRRRRRGESPVSPSSEVAARPHDACRRGGAAPRV